MESIYKAKFFGNFETTNPEFGDIIILAQGRLEKSNDGLIFAQEVNKKCGRVCYETLNDLGRNVTALWMVEKIRHRNEKMNHRFEMKFTILPLRFSEKTGEMDGSMKQKSYILREEDYPRFFKTRNAKMLFKKFYEPATDKSSIDRSFVEFQHPFQKPFMQQNFPFQINYNQNPFLKQDLNFGEYYNPYSTKNSIQHQFPYQTPPNFEHYKKVANIKFPGQETGTTIKSEYHPNSPFSHIHHHYYLNKKKVPLIKATSFEKITNYPTPTYPASMIPVDFRGAPEPATIPQNFRLTTESTSIEKKQAVSDKYRGTTQQYVGQQHFPQFQTPQYFADQLPIPPHPNQLIQIAQTPYNIPMNHLQIVTPSGGQQFYQQQSHELPPTTVQYMQPLQIPPQFSNNVFNSLMGYTIRPTHQQPQQPQQQFQETYRSQSPSPTTYQQFHESPRYVSHKFSEPDPLYENPSPSESKESIEEVNNLTETHPQQVEKPNTPSPTIDQQSTDFEIIPSKSIQLPTIIEMQPTTIQTNSIEDEVQIHFVKTTATTITTTTKSDKKFDSINAQLPPPEKGADLIVPYVETSVVTQKSVSPPLIIVPSTNFSTSESISKIVPKLRSRNFSRTARTTEKPVLKWMPKRNRGKKTFATKTPVAEEFFESTVHNFVTIIPDTSTENQLDVTPQTKRSFSTSISVKVGDSEVRRGKQSTAATTTEKLEMIKADIYPVETNLNNLKLYKASSGSEEDLDKKFDPIALSIVNHAKRVSLLDKNESK